jgi:hypothetical protein
MKAVAVHSYHRLTSSQEYNLIVYYRCSIILIVNGEPLADRSDILIIPLRNTIVGRVCEQVIEPGVELGLLSVMIMRPNTAERMEEMCTTSSHA